MGLVLFVKKNHPAYYNSEVSGLRDISETKRIGDSYFGNNNKNVGISNKIPTSSKLLLVMINDN